MFHSKSYFFNRKGPAPTGSGTDKTLQFSCTKNQLNRLLTPHSYDDKIVDTNCEMVPMTSVRVVDLILYNPQRKENTFEQEIESPSRVVKTNSPE